MGNKNSADSRSCQMTPMDKEKWKWDEEIAGTGSTEEKQGGLKGRQDL